MRGILSAVNQILCKQIITDAVTREGEINKRAREIEIERRERER